MVGGCCSEAEVIEWCKVLTATNQVVVPCKAVAPHVGSLCGMMPRSSLLI